MRHRRALALLLAAGMLCSGCSTGAISSNYRPVEDLALIQTIGVDRAPEGVCLSAATGKACENEAPKRMTQSGVSMLAALDQLQDRTPSAGLFYAQTSYLLLGEEAAAAGRAAVRYLAQGETAERHEIPVTFEGGIRYTVPASIDPKLAADDLVLRFRVGGVMKKRVVKLYLGDEAVVSRKRPVMAPGEMEELKLTKDMLDAHPGLTRIHITVEEA